LAVRTKVMIWELVLGADLHFWEAGARWLKYLSVAALCALKFVPGVLLGASLGLELWEQILATIIGGASGVFIFTYYGAKLRNWIARRLKPGQTLGDMQSAGLDWKRRFWNKYGLAGTAFLTPPVLSPPIGVGLALSFGTPKKKILTYMLASIVFWGAAFAFFKHSLLSLFY
jgi:hypothetical protein